MKRQGCIALFLFVALIVPLAGCSAPGSTVPTDTQSAVLSGSVFDSGDPMPVQTGLENNKLGITLLAADVTPTGMTLICCQYGGMPTGELQAGTLFTLEKAENSTWTNVAPLQSLCGTDAALAVKTNGETIWTVDWTAVYGKLPAGSYRICKEIMDFRSAGDFDTYPYYAEFSIL